jgi:hypothetical protein
VVEAAPEPPVPQEPEEHRALEDPLVSVEVPELGVVLEAPAPEVVLVAAERQGRQATPAPMRVTTPRR